MPPLELDVLDPEEAFLVAALRLRYGSDEPPPNVHLHAPTLADLARRHGIEPLVVRALDDRGIAVPEGVDAPLRAAAREIGIANLDATGELVRLLGLLGDAGIRAVPYKGPVLAVAAYGDPGLRRFVDLDLLVDVDDAPTAIAALEADGYEPAYELTARQLRALVRLGHDRKLMKGEQHVVEIQWAVADATNHLPRDVGPLLARAHTITIAGHELPTLAPADLAVVLAIHGSLHLWERLAWVCDLAESLRLAADARVDDADLVQLATGAGARRMLLLGVAMAARILGAVPSPGLLAIADADPVVTSLVDRLTPIVLGDGPHAAPARTQLRLAMALVDHRSDAFRKAWRSALTPTVSDWKTVPLPDAQWPLYYPVRLGRLATSYVLGDRRPGDVDLE